MHDDDKTLTLWVPDRDGWTGHQVSPQEAVHITTALVLKRRMQRRPWWDKLADYLAFFLMDLAAECDWRVWNEQHTERRLLFCSRFKEPGFRPLGCVNRKTGATWRDKTPDGWRPGRYV